MPDVSERTRRSYQANLNETEAAVDAYLGQHPGAPLTNLRSLVETPGALLPWRAKALRNTLGRHTDEPSDPQVLKTNEDTRRRARDRYSVDTRWTRSTPGYTFGNRTCAYLGTFVRHAAGSFPMK